MAVYQFFALHDEASVCSDETVVVTERGTEFDGEDTRVTCSECTVSKAFPGRLVRYENIQRFELNGRKYELHPRARQGRAFYFLLKCDGRDVEEVHPLGAEDGNAVRDRLLKILGQA